MATKSPSYTTCAVCHAVWRLVPVKEAKWTAVYDVLTGQLIRGVPFYKPGASCTFRGRKHDWVINAAHRKVCIACGMAARVTSFYRFAKEAGLLGRRGARAA